MEGEGIERVKKTYDGRQIRTRVNIQFSRFLIFIRFAVEPDKEKAWPGVTKRQYCGASTLATRHVHLL